MQSPVNGDVDVQLATASESETFAATEDAEEGTPPDPPVAEAPCPQALSHRRAPSAAVWPLVIQLAKLEHLPGTRTDSAKVFAVATWSDAVEKTDKVPATAAATEWGASLEIGSPSLGLERAARLYPYLTIDIYTVERVKNSLRARLLVPIFSLPEANVTTTWALGAPPEVAASKSTPGFGQLEARVDVSPELLRAIAAASAAAAMSPEDAQRLELLGQWNVQPSPTATTTVNIPGEESEELVIQNIEAEVSGFKHEASLVLVPSQLLVLDQQQSRGADLTMAVPRGCIASVAMQSADGTARVRVDCKDFRVITFHASSLDAIHSFSALHDRLDQWVRQLGEERAALLPEPVKRWRELSPTVEDTSVGWELNLSAEFDRQFGCTWQSEAGEFRDGGNSDFSLCDTYPRLVLVPRRASAELTFNCAKFRSKRRLPCLSWYSPKACIYRCSQPLTGPLSAHSPHDEQYVGMLREVGADAAGMESSAASKLLTIFDCRSHSAAAANSLKGAGLEDPSRYVGCERIFLDIGNIHAMRNSLDAMRELIVSDVHEFDDHESTWLPRLSSSGWLNYIRLLLGSAREVALAVRDGGHALVHCSDGWDRTSQVCALAQLLLDPYFRTIEGFKTLVQKEFVAFGHMCRKRLGTVAYPDQRSPCLLQFFECAHHIRVQCPTAFEFNDQYLQVLAALTDGELFGDFLANSEKERVDECYGQTTPSVWGHLCAAENRERYTTIGFAPESDSSGLSLIPVRCSLKYLHLWTELFCKYDETEYSAAEMAAGLAVGRVKRLAHPQGLRAAAGTAGSATGQGIPVKCESVGTGKRESDAHSEHVNYTYRLAVGLRVVGTFVTRYSRSLQAHEQFVKHGLLPRLDPPLEHPPKYRLRNMVSDEGNVRLRQHELQLYFERLLGEAGLLAVPEVRDSLGLSEASCTTLMHLLADT